MLETFLNPTNMRSFVFVDIMMEAVIHGVGLALFALIARYYVRRIEISESNIKKTEEAILDAERSIIESSEKVANICGRVHEGHKGDGHECSISN